MNGTCLCARRERCSDTGRDLRRAPAVTRVAYPPYSWFQFLRPLIHGFTSTCPSPHTPTPLIYFPYASLIYFPHTGNPMATARRCK